VVGVNPPFVRYQDFAGDSRTRSRAAALRAGVSLTLLETWGDTTLGMVTGNNRYFALSPARAQELGLRHSDLVRLSPPGSKHLRGLSFTDAALDELGAGGSAVWLFRPPAELSPAARAYIAAGEMAGINTAYKCRVRKPWWRVPLIRAADLLLTYMNADTPRLTTNRAKAHHLNSVHGVYLAARPEGPRPRPPPPRLSHFHDARRRGDGRSGLRGRHAQAGASRGRPTARSVTGTGTGGS